MGAKKLEPIDWHEFANDAVLNGNMSTLYHRPVTEDPSAYASSEALLEIERRLARPVHGAANSSSIVTPTVGIEPTVGTVPTVGLENTIAAEPFLSEGQCPPSMEPAEYLSATAEPESHVIHFSEPTVGVEPTVGPIPTVGMPKAKLIRDVQDALTLAGHVLYKTMYGVPDGAKSKVCTRGYRQLAADTHLDKDTVRDLISEFKEKGIVREVRTYDPDTRSAKTYEVLSFKAILQIWRDADLQFVTTGRKRPMFCKANGDVISRPTVGVEPSVGRRASLISFRPTVGLKDGDASGCVTDLLDVLQQITGSPVDQEAVDRLVASCRAEAADCTFDEIIEIAWSRAFLCRSGKIQNPIGFLITQVPKFFQADALQSYRQKKRSELEAAAAIAGREEERRRQAELESAELEASKRARTAIAEQHRSGKGIDLKRILQDAKADDVLKDWARRMIKLGYLYQEQYT